MLRTTVTLTLTILLAALTLSAQNGGIGNGFYEEGVVYEGKTLFQRGDNPDAIVQLEVVEDEVFGDSALRIFTQSGSRLANAFAFQLPEPVSLEVGETLVVSFDFRYQAPLMFGTADQGIYLLQVGAYLNTGPNPLFPAYKGDDSNWSGYLSINWMDDSHAVGDEAEARDSLLRFDAAGSPGKPTSNSAGNFEDSLDSTELNIDETPLSYKMTITRTDAGVDIVTTLSDYATGTPKVTMTASHTSAVDAVTSFDVMLLSFQGMVDVVADNISIGLQESGWYGYPVDAEGFVNAEDWLGVINVTFDPWVFNFAINSWMYVPSDEGWVFILRQ